MRDYNKLGLQELRSIARSLGVKSPTSLVKKDLIEKIKEIERGEVTPTFSNRGRPAYTFGEKKEKNGDEKKYKILCDKIKQVKSLIKEILSIIR